MDYGGIPGTATGRPCRCLKIGWIAIIARVPGSPSVSRGHISDGHNPLTIVVELESVSYSDAV